MLDAARWAAERCRLAPLDESAHRELLRLMATNGDVAGAVLEGRRFAERLRSELGVDPSPATRAAQAALQAPATSNPAGRRCLADPRSCALCSTPGARRPEVAVRSPC